MPMSSLHPVTGEKHNLWHGGLEDLVGHSAPSSALQDQAGPTAVHMRVLGFLLSSPVV